MSEDKIHAFLKQEVKGGFLREEKGEAKRIPKSLSDKFIITN